MKTNEEILRLSLPSLEPVAKRARMEHVDESLESQVVSDNCLLFLPKFTLHNLVRLFSFVYLVWILL